MSLGTSPSGACSLTIPTRADKLPIPTNARTEDAKRLAEDYAGGLREMLQRLRKWFN
jgi:hypothetical protein